MISNATIEKTNMVYNFIQREGSVEIVLREPPQMLPESAVEAETLTEESIGQKLQTKSLWRYSFKQVRVVGLGWPKSSKLTEEIFASLRILGTQVIIESGPEQASTKARSRNVLWGLSRSRNTSCEQEFLDILLHQRKEPLAPRRREQELEWRRSHPDVLSKLIGKWVVLELDSIVASGNDPLEVISEARQKGISVPYVFYVEPPEDGVALIGI